MRRPAVILFLLSPMLFACEQITGARILGADLARASAVFSELPADLDLGPAPLTASSRTLLPAQLERLAERNNITLVAPPEEICFERTGRLLTADDLLPVMREAFPVAAEIEILEFQHVKVPEGRIEFARSGLSPSGMWRGRVVDSSGHSVPIWARVKLTDPETGTPVPLTPPHEVERGDAVRVEVSSGGVLLAFDGAAETAGRAGDFILVKNPTTGRRFRARVESKGKVTLSR